jgi:hypothetical protein
MKEREVKTKNSEDCEPQLAGIMISDPRLASEEEAPRIHAFIWGGKIRPVPTLPFGSGRGVA